MKAAKAGDYRRTALKRKYSLSLDSLQFSGVRCLRDDSIAFANGITVIVGGNGVGKSTLAYATAIVANRARGSEQLDEHSARLNGAQLQASFTTAGGLAKVEYPAQAVADGPVDAIAADAPEIKNVLEEQQFFWLDPSDLAVRTQQQIGRDADFDDLLDAAGSRELGKDELGAASYLVGKRYEKCEMWEISDYYELPPFPYFRVTSNGVGYGSESMGRGELALLILHWAITRLPKNAILVLEEPENHVSARSQSALMNFISEACAENGLWVIITTHSSAIAESIPLGNIRLLTNTGDKSFLTSSPYRHDVAAVIGGGVHFQNIVVTEDECGKNLLLALCEILNKDLKYQVSVVSIGGDGNLNTLLGVFPKPQRWPSKLIGVYDGDMRGKKKPASEWPVIFLPGNCAPEELLQTVLSADSAGRFASILGVEEKDVYAAIDATTGLDHHDWHETLATTLGRDKMAVTFSLARLWVETNRAAADELIADLAGALA